MDGRAERFTFAQNAKADLYTSVVYLLYLYHDKSKYSITKKENKGPC